MFNSDCKGNTKEFWKALKETLPSSKPPSTITSITVDGIVFTSAQSIATAVNSFFVNVGRKLAQKIIPETLATDLPPPTDDSVAFSFKPISEKFVSNTIRHLKPNKAVGLDKISAHLLKDATDVISPTLTALFNMSLQTRTFPFQTIALTSPPLGPSFASVQLPRQNKDGG